MLLACSNIPWQIYAIFSVFQLIDFDLIGWIVNGHYDEPYPILHDKGRYLSVSVNHDLTKEILIK